MRPKKPPSSSSSRGTAPRRASRRAARRARAARRRAAAGRGRGRARGSCRAASLRGTACPGRGARARRPAGCPRESRPRSRRPGPGTVSDVPSAACVIVSSTAVWRSSPSRSIPGCGVTPTWTKRSPAGPPSSPACPSPRTRMRCPSAMPAGMSMSTVAIVQRAPDAVARLARRLDDAADALAARAGAGADELAEDALGDLLHAAGAAAHVAGDAATFRVRRRCRRTSRTSGRRASAR